MRSTPYLTFRPNNQTLRPYVGLTKASLDDPSQIENDNANTSIFLMTLANNLLECPVINQCYR